MSGIMQRTTVVVYFVLIADRTTGTEDRRFLSKRLGLGGALEFATKVLERLEAVWTTFFASSVCCVQWWGSCCG